MILSTEVTGIGLPTLTRHIMIFRGMLHVDVVEASRAVNLRCDFL